MSTKIFPLKTTLKRYEKVIKKTMEKSEGNDELEYVISLLEFSNAFFIHERDSVRELIETIEDFTKIMQNKDNLCIENRTFIKLFSYLYVHITELEDLYVYLFNILNTSLGNHFERYPFKINELSKENFLQQTQDILNQKIDNDQKSKLLVALTNKYQKREEAIWTKINIIDGLSIKTKSELGNILKEIYDNLLRNAFSHNDYRFSDLGLHYGINHKKFLSFEQLLELFSNALAFIAIVGDSAFTALGQYKDKGRITIKGKYGEMTLTPIIDSSKSHWKIEATRSAPYI